MSRIPRRRVLAIVLTSVGICFLVASLPSNANPGSLHVDLTAFCQRHGFQGVTHGSNGYSWKCTPINSYTIDMNLACREEHGPNSRAYLINDPPGGIYDWRCTGASQVSINCYCKMANNCSSIGGAPEHDWGRDVGGAAPLTPLRQNGCRPDRPCI